MPLRDWKLRIKDIVDAVIRNLTVIGEAAGHLPDDIVSAYPDIPWRDMRDMRNFVVHEYFGISDKIIWDTVYNNLPPLIPLLKPLLRSEDPDTNS